MATKMGIANFMKIFPSIDKTDNPGAKDKVCITVPSQPKPRAATESPLLQLNHESVRLETFATWNIPFIDKHKLAMLGFYYIGPNDMVKCYFCRVEIGLWEEGDDVLVDHQRWSPYCNFIKRRPTDNVPINAELLDQTLPARLEPETHIEPQDESMSFLNYFRSSADQRNTDDVHMLQHQLFNSGGFDSVLRNNTPRLASQPLETERLKHPEHPEYAVEANRLKSFEDWPKTMRQKPQELSDAGFFYTGKGDRVACFSCGGGLKDWEPSDNPWEQHGMWYGKCEYVQLVKGAEYVKKMAEKRQHELEQTQEDQAKSSTEQPSSSNSKSNPIDSLAESSKEMAIDDEVSKNDDKKQINESRLCKICFTNEYNTAFYPCGHVIACAKCASSVSKCPCCRQPFNNVIRVYFS